ncbi:FAD/FMN-containing dehydrogenase/Fe-S oxidoreductase [Kitasatospora sp. MAA19]|uniref:FAD-binding and (Fe-S)-binding domain-containing protein n=1 Tax=Kitasatospora sp. MAA19 TaxID=3035090 RepID=UPI002476017E|nr:FAD-binding and (Fe-S)-binding domain-containing protein [Kitasatospora sp. MAA19]MDH6710005.1 FAD/FMN-containing dehydrogenase/Fe-S oxidoreductase [Kitasatospora sp. MAA19]
MSRPSAVPGAELARELAAVLCGEVRFGTAERTVYSHDASNYRQLPLGVVKPADLDDVRTALALCRQYGVPVVPRGAGTSIGGQAIGPGAVVLDFRRHLGAVLDVDPQARTARVQPGTVLDDLQRAARPYGLRFGPDPSTHSRCTLGGMIGNNSCGSHSLAWGRTADNVEQLELLLADGTELTVGGRLTPEERAALRTLPGRAGELHRGLQEFTDRNLATIRQGLPELPRRTSGYPLDALLPERGHDLARALTGTEGTCALLLGATVRLVEEPPARALVVAGYPDEGAAADAIPALLPLRPLTAEGMAADLIAALLAAGPRPPALDRLPAGECWLFLETGGATPVEAYQAARRLADEVRRERSAAVALVTDPTEQRQLWAVREAGAGIVTRLPGGGEAWPGWEDSAVPPERLGDYLRDLRGLLRRHSLRGVPYGHFGDGCVHLRIDFPLDEPQGVLVFREFLEQAADLVVSYGGSLSGEHGDGQARAELLPRMYSPEVIALFGEFKRIWDPENLLNPGALVNPRPLDADLRFVTAPRRPLPLALPYEQDGGSLAKAVHRCVGVAKCVDPSTGVMCPSYMATGEERHSTRGRARLLAEMLRGAGEPSGHRTEGAIPDGWRSAEVREALDLCLSCKGCASDCPVHVDMATYKTEFLYQHYRHRPRPLAHYSMGWLPLWLRAAALAPGAANTIARSPAAGLLKRLGGIDRRRVLPILPPETFTRWYRRHRATHPAPAGARPVLLWPDTFSDHLQPNVLRSAVEVLEHLGFDVRLPAGPVCCGLTWYSTGQLGTARRVLRRSLRVLADDALPADTPVVGMDPSCTATLREDLPRLLGPDGRPLAERTRTFAEFLDEYAPHAPLPRIPLDAVTQTHCHQHAVLGSAADRRVEQRLGLRNRVLDSGCCGLAGNFGFEQGHFEISEAIAERVLLPEVRAAAPDTVVLADGFSCRTQIAQLAEGRQALHLSELIARALR